MRRILIGFLIGLVLGVFFFVLAAVSDGACHCVKGTIALFPYAGLALLRSWDSLSLPLIALQFPFYSLVISKLNGARWKTLAVIIILLVHATVAAIGLNLNTR